MYYVPNKAATGTKQSDVMTQLDMVAYLDPFTPIQYSAVPPNSRLVAMISLLLFAVMIQTWPL
jgi:hypothetical protein